MKRRNRSCHEETEQDQPARDPEPEWEWAAEAEEEWEDRALAPAEAAYVPNAEQKQSIR